MSFMIALDTNVLIYACDRADPRRQSKALELIASTNEGILLWQVACEFIAASRKLSTQGFTQSDAWSRLIDFLLLFPLVTPSPQVLMRAKEMHLKQGWSFWDAMIVAACMECGISRLYSEDLPGRAAPAGVEIVNPFD
jgi:predicted nucleic acid-binding protein